MSVPANEQDDPPANVDRRRRRLRRLGFAFASVVVAVPVVLALASGVGVLSRHYEDEPWAVIGTADGGQTVLIALTPAFSGCVHGPHVSVVRQTSRVVEIRARASDGPCPHANGRFLRGTVSLTAPLAGRTITGPLARDPRAITNPLPPRMPDLTGFTPAVAESVVQLIGLTTITIDGPRGAGTAVTGQTPKVGIRFPDEWPLAQRRATRVVLTTVRRFTP